MHTFRYFILLLIIFTSFFCKKTHHSTPIVINNEAIFMDYLLKGDSIYATKTGNEAFAKSMVYFDSALMIAHKAKDSLMIAESIFAKGRVYDAWNKEPLKTIQYFKEAALLYKQLNNDEQREYYIRHLIAHAYDKMQDSSNCVNVLTEMYDALSVKSDSTKRKMDFIPQMAYISTTVKNYDLAEKILHNLYYRAWITNNPNTYNFEDFYFLTKSRIDINKYNYNKTRYIDSFTMTLKHIKNPMDSVWYLNELIGLYGKAGRYEQAFKCFKTHQDLNNQLNNASGIESMHNKLLSMELQAEHRKLETEQQAKKATKIIWSILITGILIVTALLLRILKGSQNYQKQSEQMLVLNTLLEHKIHEEQLANKEIQHRVKNNLHLIFSLLNMQERKSNNLDTIENLQKAKLRIESIAGLHDQLSKHDNESIDFNDYIHNLIQVIIDCIETEYKVITNTKIDKIQMPHNYYFSIGLILNEWITNSIKYAKTNTSLSLYIKITQNEDYTILEYYDSGQIITEEKKHRGLGTEIILLLTKQMRGELTQKDNNPYHYLLKIKSGK